jgi:hypothetical protein
LAADLFTGVSGWGRARRRTGCNPEQEEEANWLAGCLLNPPAHY